MGNIPYNLTAKDFGSYGDGLNGTIKMPIPSSYIDVSEIGIAWGTILCKIIGRAKGFGGVGTIYRNGTVEINFPTTFLHIPIIKLKLVAPKGYNYFDTVHTPWNNNNIPINFFGDDRDAVWKDSRIVHDSWERRDTPLQMSVWTDHLWLGHLPEERVIMSPYGDLDREKIFDARGEDLIFIWHAFGV